MIQKKFILLLLVFVGLANMGNLKHNTIELPQNNENEYIEEVHVDELQKIKSKYSTNLSLKNNEQLIVPSDVAPSSNPDYVEYTNKSLYSVTSFTRKNYFENLSMYSALNSVGSCGFVSLIQAMSFYDTFYNDDIIPEMYEAKYLEATTESGVKTISPGVKRQSQKDYGSKYSTYYDYCHGEDLVDDFQSQLTIAFNKVRKTDKSGTYYDKNQEKYIDYFQASLGAWDYQDTLNQFYGNDNFVTVHTLDGFNQTEFVSLIKENIASGNPVIVHILTRNSEGKESGHHSAVAYAYDESGIYANFGWGDGSTSELLLGGKYGYNEIYYAATLDYSNLQHKHSDNYVINKMGYCGCNISDAIVFTNDPKWSNVPPSFYWMKNLYDPDETFTISFRNTANGSNIKSITTQYNQLTLSYNIWKSVMNGCQKGVVYMSIKRNSKKVNYAETITTILKPSLALESVSLSPTDYGFADAYPVDDDTMNNYKVHTLSSGFSFKTRRYRTGYIHDEYIVMSCIKSDITEAFIEYNFNTPVYQIDVELAHWREYSHEWLDKDKGIAELQIWHTKDWWNPFDSNRWVQKFDLLSDETALPRDRTNPTKYTIKFDKPVMSFRFYSKINVPDYSSSNRGRLCIGDMKVYLEY